MTAATHYNEQAYGPKYYNNPHAISPNGLNTAADFVEGLYFWARNDRQKASDTYRDQAKATAVALERAAITADTHTANAYKYTARQLRTLARDYDRTRTKPAITKAAGNLFEALREYALTTHSRHTDRAERYTREQLEQRRSERQAETRPT